MTQLLFKDLLRLHQNKNVYLLFTTTLYQSLKSLNFNSMSFPLGFTRSLSIKNPKTCIFCTLKHLHPSQSFFKVHFHQKYKSFDRNHTFSYRGLIEFKLLQIQKIFIFHLHPSQSFLKVHFPPHLFLLLEIIHFSPRGIMIHFSIFSKVLFTVFKSPPQKSMSFSIRGIMIVMI